MRSCAPQPGAPRPGVLWRSIRGRSVRRRLDLALPAVALAVTLSACSSGASSADISATASTFTAADQTPTTATPNTGVVTSPVSGSVTSKDKAFNFVVPSGWNLSDNPKAVAYLSSATQSNNVAPTIVVERSSIEPAPALEEIAQMGSMQARQDGGEVTTLPGRTIGGEKAVGFSSKKKLKNVNVTQFFYATAHDRKLYTIVLTSATPDAKRSEDTLNQLLASWSWAVPGNKDSTASGTTPASSSTTTVTSSSSSSGSSTKSSGPSKSSAGSSSSGSASGKPSGSATSSTSQPAKASSTASSASQ